ncbi:conserved hypothetical protein [Capnocytophaga canimorsus]|uniref:DNA methylase N-4/N-6 domain-containing protein n=1 Tax=Capnocytophaga canimorsus TaxID=28188 RepID=A0A0B7IKG8_9FLAO|nr:DNA methyltransferase [Capnocytophaga canimorsus]CEN52361.1 conserved hypothetical protein [Capnocytophaga canimorsus]
MKRLIKRYWIILKSSVFSYPKPTSLIKYLINFVVNNTDDIILDFFAGSGTTGDAVIQLNASDGGNRRFILVQLPEPTNPKSEAYKLEYITVFDITKERLIRAGKRIREASEKEFPYKNEVQIGFKIFETTPIWEDYGFEADTFSSQLSFLIPINFLMKI